MHSLLLAGFFKGPIGMAALGATVAITTAATGITAGPMVARAVIERVNATAVPTALPSPAATPKVGSSVAPKVGTSTAPSGGSAARPLAAAAAKVPSPSPTAKPL